MICQPCQRPGHGADDCEDAPKPGEPARTGRCPCQHRRGMDCGNAYEMRIVGRGLWAVCRMHRRHQGLHRDPLFDLEWAAAL